MTISYPLSFPVATKVIQNIEMRAVNAVAYARSPFTFAGQAFAYSGQMWTADITLKPMKRADAEQWVAWLISLRGQLGTFLLGDPNGATPRGTALANRVNLLTYTEQFDNAAWTKSGVTITANTAVAPDGASTADKLVEDTANSQHSIRVTNQFTATGAPYSYSVYVKQAERRYVTLSVNGTFNSTAATPIFDTQTGVWVATGSLFTNFFAQSVGNGWWRIGYTNSVNDPFYDDFRVGLSNGTASTNTTYTGDGTSGILVWGAQLEAGSTATTYQPIFNSYGPYVNGASQTGGSLIIDGASPDETGYLLAGDYIQLGSNGSSTLHKVLTNVDTDSSGNATLDIWPHIRTAPADNATVTVSSAKGLFRLSSNEQAWSVNEAAIYGITFGAMEAV